ncbi:sodium:solute symporter [Niveispirillum lacus]|uniref:Sodium:solute symporter n=1 Tax=Niveispirillum lacus TaxID=1981099 RepID=A0A255ZB00_9PROT|nr:sodium:solute symporter [Niveispirillum lacus]OYQ37790.1 sodium:solute symporter [Niveispirillum lacus]
MELEFTILDWSILLGYILIIAVAGMWSSRSKLENASDYFLAGQRVPMWLVAISVLSATQSAATFLGAPDYGYRGDYTYLTSYLGCLVAAFIVAKVLMPRFYAVNASTVYELLRHRYSASAMRAAGGMYLVGRLFASGARLYLASIAVSMIVFLDIEPQDIVLSSLILVVFGLAFTFIGGLRAVIWSDLVQVVIYVGAAIAVLIFLLNLIPLSMGEIVTALSSTPSGEDKLRLFDLSLDFSAPFTLLSIVTGFALLNVGNFGLDQDTTQRLLSCRNHGEGSRALYVSVFVAVPVVFIFISIGSLLYIFYDRPDLMMRVGSGVSGEFNGEKITIFMHFILSQIPPGLRGFVTVGVIAAAAVNSGLISMSSVLIQDFYRPWMEARQQMKPEAHYVRAGQFSMLLLGGLLFGMSIVCYYWQQYSDAPLLEFVLGVMTFAYAGLLGVYFAAVFTRRGSSASVMAALVTGFLAIVLQQDYIVDMLGLPAAWKSLAFPWQLLIGIAVSFLTCISVRTQPGAGLSDLHAGGVSGVK